MMMRKSIHVILPVAFGLLLPALALAGAKTATAACPADISNLSLTVMTDDPGYRLLPDLVGQPYKTGGTGKNQVSAVLQQSNCSFDLVLNLGSSTRFINVNFPGMPSTTKFLNFDRIGSVPFTDGSAAFQNWCNTPARFNADGSVAKNADGTYADVYAPCGTETDPVTGAVKYFARRNVGMDLAGSYSLRFQNSPIDGASQLANSTATIRVYHYAATATGSERWELTPDADFYTFTSYSVPFMGYFTDTSSTPDLQERAVLLYHPPHGAISVSGYASMPFKAVVTKF
jgi:hypothetical protein